MSIIYLGLRSRGDHHHQHHHPRQGPLEASMTLPSKNPAPIFPFLIGGGGGHGSDHAHLMQQQQAMVDHLHPQPQLVIGGSSSVLAPPHAAGDVAASAAPARVTRKARSPTAGVGAARSPGRRDRRSAPRGRGQNGGGGAAGSVCSDCGTTRTPLWRGGPRGPKSLCNACGIRQRKARWALMPGGGRGGVSKLKKEKIGADVNHCSLPFKKRCNAAQDHAAAAAASPIEAAAAAVAAACFRPSSSSSAAAAEEEQKEITEAAMMLMTLSCAGASRARGALRRRTSPRFL